jgi:hypothetical protein
MIGSIPLKSLAATEFPSGSEMSAHRKRPRDFSQAAKLVIDIATGQVEDRPPTPEEQGKDPAAAALGRKGGKARAGALSANQRREIARKAAKSRWRKDE